MRRLRFGLGFQADIRKKEENMPSLFDMMANAENGNGIGALARQFGLSQEQTQAALQALLPAFSQGLKHNVADPYGLGAFMTAMAGGQHKAFFDNAAAAASPAGVNEGNAILGQLFGSKDLSRAVAGQAAQATGIGQNILAQMLPVIASMLMGGMAKQAGGQSGTPQQPGSGNIFGDLLQQMMQGGMMGAPGGQPQQSAPQAAPGSSAPGSPASDPFGGNPFGKMLQDMLGGATGGTPQFQPSANPYGADNPLGRILEQMMGGNRQDAGSAAPDAGQPSSPGNRPRNPYDDIFGKMFDAGSKMQDDYQKNMESVVDQFMKGMDRFR
jgi:hypothetical protein